MHRSLTGLRDVTDDSYQLGAIRFDRDLRAVMAYLSSQTVFGDIREKFIRLQQIATVLNLDSVRVPLNVTDSHN